jgi:hypothetical protein
MYPDPLKTVWNRLSIYCLGQIQMEAVWIKVEMHFDHLFKSIYYSDHNVKNSIKLFHGVLTYGRVPKDLKFLKSK